MRILTGAVVLLLGVAMVNAQRPASNASAGIDDVARGFVSPPPESRIMMRWWWFGPTVAADEIAAELQQMKDGGIGGVELAVVYPLAVDDPQRGVRNDAYLSAPFLDAVAVAAAKARALGLRMDVTLGSGWPYGGRYITPALASTRLRSERREIGPGATRVARPHAFDGDRLVAVFVGPGSAQEVDPAAFRELPVAGEGPVDVPAGDGPRVLLFYFSGQTGQVVKRAAVGADGYALDHYNRAAIDLHLRETGDKLLAAGRGAIESVFCDSLEVYDADWTADFLDQFRARRGYDVRPLLPLAELGSGERADAVRRDYGRTLTELFDERFLEPMRQWAAANRVRFRIQNYGAPPASLASARHADIVDGEGFEWRTLSSARWASSAAHLLNKPIVSSETWTWLHSPAFRATPLDLKGEADLHFLSGINQLIGHGWPYSPPAAGSPGWMFYAAGAFNAKNPWWPVMPDLARYLQRVSFVLRQGEPAADVALYAPTEDAWAQIRPATGRGLNLWSSIRDAIGSETVPAILDSGHTFDLFDDGTLAEAASRRYRAVVVPRLRAMPESTRRWMENYAAGGGVVVRDGPGAGIAAQLTKNLAAEVAFEPRSPEVGFIHRRLADADVYFLANTSNVPRRVQVRFADRAASTELWDPMTAVIVRGDERDGAVAIEFQPYGSWIVVRRASTTAPRRLVRQPAETIDLRTGWTLRYGDADATAAVDLPHSWADAGGRPFFSGRTTYTRMVNLPSASRNAEARVVLDFGAGEAVDRETLPGGTMRGNSFAALIAPPVREAAVVSINGRRAGAVWAPPYRVDITELLRDGPNEIRVEVYNTAINQLAEGGRLPDVAAVAERYGQRFRLQDLEAIQPIPSGLTGSPRLIVER